MPRMGFVFSEAAALSSMKLSHCPQSGQRPNHLGDWYPHDRQLKTTLAFFLLMALHSPQHCENSGLRFFLTNSTSLLQIIYRNTYSHH
jgi:hypothetical protein